MPKELLIRWVHEALRRRGGRASIVNVAQEIWDAHEVELRGSGDLFFTWQYDMRWAAWMLRRRGVLRPAEETDRGIWELIDQSASRTESQDAAISDGSEDVESDDPHDEARAWVFQANQRLWDLEGGVAALPEITWVVRRHRGEIHAGDAVYLWESGPHAGVVAVATVVTEPEIRQQLLEEQRFAQAAGEFGTAEHRVLLRIEHVLSERLARDNLLDHPVLGDLTVIRAPTGTNFEVTSAQAEALDELIDSSPRTSGNRPLQTGGTELVPESEIRTFAEGEDAAYEDWIGQHGGWVLTERSGKSRKFMLHDPDCSHLSLGPNFKLTNRPRRWALRRQALVEWAENSGVTVQVCQDCM